jgi:transcription initiation factor TFIIIB Brf1 subunit/transcription initiation factor TFIIB
VIKAMATYKALENSSLSRAYSHLKCDMCGSTDIIDTKEGYVCGECGIVLEVLKLQYDRPYNEEVIQNAPSQGPTRIGSNRERRVSPISAKLRRLERQNSIVSNKEAVNRKAKAEIDRVFSNLQLNEYESLKKMVFEKFKYVRNKLRKGVKYRNTDKLVSIITYFCIKIRNIAVNGNALITASKITKKEFNDFCLQIKRYIPEYMDRNRQEYILNRVFEITQHFNLGMDFFHLARKILKKLWHGIKNTTDNALAGLACSISLLCSENNDVTVSAICTHLGIRMSTVQAQVKKKIIHRFQVSGFVSLIKSAGLLAEVMGKLGLIHVESEEVIEEVVDDEVSEIVQVVIGNAPKVYNAIGQVNYYYFVIKGEQNTPVFIKCGLYNFDESTKKPEKHQGEAIIEMSLCRYPLPTGPP